MKKSFWFLIGLVTNLVVSSSIIVSCGHNEQKPFDDPLNYDQKFSFNKATYDKLEDDFKSALSNKIVNADRFPQPEKWDKKIKELGGSAKIMSQLDNDLASFQASFFEENGEFYSSSFNTKTQSLINFAKQKYDINLSREIDKKAMQNECEEIKKSYLDYLTQSLEIAYKNDPEKVTKINGKINDFNSTFSKFVNQLNDYVDKASALNNLRLKLTEFISSIDNDLILLVAQNQLKDFLENYHFEVDKEKVNDDDTKHSTYLWENLLESDYYGKDISQKKDLTGIMDNVFTISNVKQKNIFADIEDTIVPSWNDIRVSGYRLLPYIHDMVGDKFQNVYQVEVDWQLVDAKLYKEKLAKYNEDESNPNFQKEIDAITAHSCNPNNYSEEESKLLDEDANKEIQESRTIVENNEHNLSAYYWPVSNEFATQALFETYIYDSEEDKDKKLKFDWLDDQETIGYDTFLLNYNEKPNDDGKYVAKVNTLTLANCGLKINNQLLSEILDAIETDNTNDDENKTNIDDFVKKCLVNCDLSGEYYFTNPEQRNKCQVDVKLILSYKVNDDKDKDDNQVISCNPLASSLNIDEQSNSKIPVKENIIHNFSKNSYKTFCNNYKHAKDLQDLENIKKNLDGILASIIVLIIFAAAVLAFMFITFVVQAIRWRKWEPTGLDPNNDQIPEYQNRINSINACKKVITRQFTIMFICFALLSTLVIWVDIHIVNILEEYQDKIDKFIDETKKNKDAYPFVKKINEYDDYYSECNDKGEYIKPEHKQKYDSLQDKEGIKKWLEMTKYLNNIDQNEEYKDFKEAKQALNPHEWSTFETCLIVAFAIALFMITILTLYILGLISLAKEHMNVDQVLNNGDPARLVFVKESRWFTFLQSSLVEIFGHHTDTIDWYMDGKPIWVWRPQYIYAV